MWSCRRAISFSAWFLFFSGGEFFRILLSRKINFWKLIFQVLLWQHAFLEPKDLGFQIWLRSMYFFTTLKCRAKYSRKQHKLWVPSLTFSGSVKFLKPKKIVAEKNFFRSFHILVLPMSPGIYPLVEKIRKNLTILNNSP